MKVPTRDNSKYSINLKIFKLQSTGNGSSVGEKKTSAMSLPITQMMPTPIQKKRISWRNAWKLANHNNSQSIKSRNNKNTANNAINNKDTNNKDKINEEFDKNSERLKGEEYNNENNVDKKLPLENEDMLCKCEQIKYTKL